jgi:membrane protein YqaA with SNARE-associated domain
VFSSIALFSMDNLHIPQWLQIAVAASGGLGLFLIAFLDSSFLPFPSVNDLLLIDLSFQAPLRMPYYAGMATLGSLAGCLCLYVIARKGEEAAFHKRVGPRAAKIRRWVERNGFGSLLLAAIMPPPTPFKGFVLAAGAFKMPVRQFVMALLIARALRFYGEGYLALRYGAQAVVFLSTHKFAVLAGALVFVAFVVLVVQILLRVEEPERPA